MLQQRLVQCKKSPVRGRSTLGYLREPGYSRYYTGHMSIDTTWQIESTGSDFTEQLAEKIGKALRGGEVIELASDLGGGKTTFVRGLARGMGSADRVASPTFTISKVYEAPNKQLSLHHFDFYRLHEAGLIGEELADVLHDKHIVTVVEWADIIQNVLPTARLTITIHKMPHDVEARLLTFTAPKDLQYLVEAAQS